MADELSVKEKKPETIKQMRHRLVKESMEKFHDNEKLVMEELNITKDALRYILKKGNRQ